MEIDRRVGPCAHCGVFTTRRCPLCRVYRFCSAECQFARWGAHKWACESIAAARRDPRSALAGVELLMRLDAAIAAGGTATAFTDDGGTAHVVVGDRAREKTTEGYRMITSERRLPLSLARGFTRRMHLRWTITQDDRCDPIVRDITGFGMRGRAVLTASYGAFAGDGEHGHEEHDGHESTSSTRA